MFYTFRYVNVPTLASLPCEYLILCVSLELNRFRQKAPFVAKREQEAAAIQAAADAAMAVPAMHKRYLDGEEGADGIQEIVVSYVSSLTSCYTFEIFASSTL